MGLDIGAIGRSFTDPALNTPRRNESPLTTPPGDFDREDLFPAAERGDLRRGLAANRAVPPREGRFEEEVTPRAGFGDDTISFAGAALTALDGSVRVGREVVPTLEEQQQRVQAQLDELRRVFQPEQERPVPQEERNRDIALQRAQEERNVIEPIALREPQRPQAEDDRPQLVQGPQLIDDTAREAERVRLEGRLTGDEGDPPIAQPVTIINGNRLNFDEPFEVSQILNVIA